jgi:hypothetical protein
MQRIHWVKAMHDTMSIAMKLRLLLIACIAALVAFPAGSLAASCAPPGNAGVNQYVETVPGASCGHSTTSGGGHQGGGTLPPGTGAQLANQGSVGNAVKRLVASSGVTSRGSGSGAAGSGTGKTHSKSSGKSAGIPAANVSGSGRDPLSGLVHPVLTGSSSGGIGVLLPVLLGSALALALLLTVLRRRFHSTGPQT